jgi:hypothetical protein
MRVVYSPHAYRIPSGATKGLLVHLSCKQMERGDDPTVLLVDDVDAEEFLSTKTPREYVPEQVRACEERKNRVAGTLELGLLISHGFMR